MRIVLAAAAVMLMVPLMAYAEPVTVETDQQVYFYGDHLSFTVTVQQVTDNNATFRLIDENGIGSSTLIMAITGKENVLTSPSPFESVIFDVGTYTITVLYDGHETSTQFKLEDPGGIRIPFWMRDVANLWLDRILDDTAFLKNLADEGIIETGQAVQEERGHVPAWYREVVRMWVDGVISDEELIHGIQYMISTNIITIGMRQ